MNFRIDTLYTETIGFQYGCVTSECADADVLSVLTDGRPTSHLVQAHLSLRFGNLSIQSIQTRKSGNKKPRKVVYIAGRQEKYILRTITNRGLSLIPSKNIGIGRIFSKQDFKDLLRQITGYILVDVRRGAHLRYGAIHKDRIPLMRHLDAEMAEYYLSRSKQKVTL